MDTMERFETATQRVDEGQTAEKLSPSISDVLI